MSVSKFYIVGPGFISEKVDKLKLSYFSLPVDDSKGVVINIITILNIEQWSCIF